MAGFNIEDYVTVAERIGQFYEKYPEGSLQAEVLEITDHRVVVRACAYRHADDARPGIAHSMLGIPGSTPYTKGSELENAETSAVGRAIALLGFGVKKSIASADELRGKGADVRADVDRGDDGSLIGVVQVTDKQTSDYLLRTDAARGPTLGFRLRGDRGGILVRAFGPLAVQLDALRDAVVGQRITAWGRVGDEVIPADARRKAITYQVLEADRVRVPGIGMLPTDAPDPAGNEVGDAEADELWAGIEQGAKS
jgi:hypothetical protein